MSGFQRENLPQIKRRQDREELPVQVAAPAPAPPMTAEPVYEPMHASAMAAAPDPEPQRMEEQPAQIPLSDLDMPAYLRRDRRYYQ